MHHIMTLTMTHATGAQEYYCGACGRRVLITWQPWSKIVLSQGDEHAAHSGGTGGVTIGAPVLDPTDVDGPDATAWALPPDAAARLLRTIFEDEADTPSAAPWAWLDGLEW